ncbi:MAG: response regulator [Lachnospiraceae bacterium]|nr:response regulator [Lachnospiraceae bacterium]MBR1855369.1 response regulator [Lachnospiraceae bacterium]
MFSQLFGKYLVKHSLLNEETYQQIIDKQMSVRVKLGTIAVAEGILTEEQVEEINRLQRQLDKRFGDIAVEKKLLTPQQIDSLLSKQGNAYLQFVQLLTELTDLTAHEIEQHLKVFQKESGFSDSEMEALKLDNIDDLIPLFVFSSKPYIIDIAGLVARNLTRFVSRDYYIEKARHMKELSYAHLSCQELCGDATIFLGIAEESDEGEFLKIASEFSHEEMDRVNADAYDAVSEFINVTNGLFASELSKKGTNVDMEPPLSFKNQTATGDFYAISVYLENKKINILIAVNSDFTAGQTPENLGAVTTGTISSVSENSAGTVLIVDDSKMSRTMLRNILEKANYSVVMEAANGMDGVEAYKKCKPDVVTLDITMPQMDGLEALTQILAFDPHAKAIMITAAGQQDKLIQALKTGAKRFINKPFNEEEIINNIHDVLK